MDAKKMHSLCHFHHTAPKNQKSKNSTALNIETKRYDCSCKKLALLKFGSSFV
jgi:hypothetical protein